MGKLRNLPADTRCFENKEMTWLFLLRSSQFRDSDMAIIQTRDKGSDKKPNRTLKTQKEP